MSVVKKFASGGQVNNEFESYIGNFVNSDKFTRKSIPYVQKAAKALIDLHKSGDLDKSVEFDPVTQKYIVNIDKVPEEYREYLVGSPDVKTSKNLLGKISNDPKSINEALLSEYYRFKQDSTSNTNTKEEPKNSGITRSLAGLQDFILNKDFSGSEEAYEKHMQGLTPDAAKNYILEAAGRHFSDYEEQKRLNSLKPESERDIFTDTPHLEDVKKSIGLGYEAFEKEAQHLGSGWLDLLKFKPTEQTTEDSDIKRLYEDYRNKGISDEVAKELISAGYDQYETSDKIGGVEIPGLQDYLKSKNYTALKDKYGAVKIIGKSGNIIPQEVISNPNNPLYGTYWNTENGVLNIYTKGVEGWKSDLFKDPLEGKSGWVGLNASIPKYQGYTVRGYSSGATNAIGLPDYTKHLLLTKEGESPIEIVNKDGKYYDLNNNLVDVDISGIGDIVGNNLSDLTLRENDKLGSLTAKEGFTSIEEAENTFNKLGKEYTRNSGPIYAKILKDLLYRIQFPKNLEEKYKADRLYSHIRQLLPDSVNDDILMSDLKSEVGYIPQIKFVLPTGTPIIFKSGGKVIKGSKGLSLNAYIAKYKPITAEEKENPKDEKLIRDIRGTLKDSSAWEKASLAGAAASIIPGVGAIGGAITTISDIAEDISKDGFQIDDIVNWNTAANLGFTALGLIGAGGIGTAAKAGKIASKVGKVASNAAKVAGAVTAGSSVINAAKDWKEGGFSNVQVNDAKNALLLTSALTGVLNNKYLTRKGESLKISNPDETPILTAGEKEFVLPKASELKVPKIEKPTMKFFNKEKAANTNTKNLDDFKKKFKTLTGEDLPEDVTLDDLKITEAKKSGLKSLEESGLSESVYSKAVKTLNNSLNYWNPSWWKFDKGGVLPEITVYAKMPSLFKRKEITSIPTNLDVKTLATSKTTTPNITTNTTSTTSTSGGDIVKTPKNWMSLSKLNNVTPLERNMFLNSLLYANTIGGINKMGALTRRAIVEGVSRENLLSTPYIRIKAQNLPMYDVQASNIKQVGKNISEATSNLDAGNAARLSAAEKAANVRLQGSQADQQFINSQEDKQLELTQKVNQYNSNIDSKNRANVAGAASKLFQSGVNDTMLKSQSFANLLQGINVELDKQEYRNRAKDYYNIITSPESKDLNKRWNQLNIDEAIARQAFDDRVSKIGSTVGTGEWEKSPEYLKFKTLREELTKLSSNISSNINAAQWAMQYGLPIQKRASGGTLQDKVYLENLKQKNREELAERREYFKSILKNNELLLKSLIKIFK